MKEIIDVYVEGDPIKRTDDRTIFSLTRQDKALNGFNFQIQTQNRIFRLQSSTKFEQMIWVRAFAVMFELRARIISNFKSIDSSAGK